MPHSETCSYCHGSRSLMMGHVYCSREKNKMEELETGFLLIRSKKLEETLDHVSRLSIRCMLNGNQYFRVGSHDMMVSPKNYLIINQGQHYKTSFSADQELEMTLVAFKPGFAEGLLHSLMTPDDKLLGDPYSHSQQPVTFFEKTYEADPFIRQSFLQLTRLINEDVSAKKEIDLDGIYTSMLTRLLLVHRSIRKDLVKVDALKHSTRVELFRRLHVAHDYMEAHACEKISLIAISKVACLSVHHFKRAFHRLFLISPHRFLILKRIERAKELLHNSELKIDEVGTATGFESDSSFIRVFRHHAGVTPGNFRAIRN